MKKNTHFLLSFYRNSSSFTRNRHVCIVGAGPAGFYAAMHLKKHLENTIIDIIEMLPVPFGLIRYGVAPDHPEVKNVINQFTKLMHQPNVNFYGNIYLGKDVKLTQLREHYDAVLLAYGAQKDKKLGIENENANNVIAAKNFVRWYNGFPEDRNLQIDLSKEKVAIIGQGNVALDVSRILLSPIDNLKNTDLTEYALATLSTSRIKEVYLIGRRGPLQAAFTIKELREQLKIQNCKTLWRHDDFVGIEDLIKDLPRPRKRLTELMFKSLDESFYPPDTTFERYFKPIFYRSPNRFHTDSEKNLTGIELICNKLVDEKLVSTNETEFLDCSLVLRSIGYECEAVDNDLVVDSNGVVENSKGCVLESSENLAKVFAAGWVSTGSVGVILHTMGNAFQVAKNICDHINQGKTLQSRGGFTEIRKLLSSEVQIVDWDGWEKIDKYEIELGKSKNKPREKITSINKMLQVAAS